jgi:hypothetical protein
MTLIPASNYRVVQKGRGGMAPRLQLQLAARFSLAAIERYQQRQRDEAEGVRARVYAVREAAVARGVQVVVDETRPDEYTISELSDEE